MSSDASAVCSIFPFVLQLGQKVDEDWPLTVVDHQGRPEKIVLKPGQMVLYESATIPHGRQFPLNGDFYDNLFVHFVPLAYDIYIKENKNAT